MSDITTATFAALELRVPDDSERIVEGIVVPWNETSFLTPDPAGERFLPGSLTRTVRERGGRIKLFRTHAHDRAIGKAVKWDPRNETGLWAQFRIANTPAGDEVLHEVHEGMLDAFSIGFRATKSNRGADGAREISEAALHETSLAPLGAYDGAQVLAFRQPATEFELGPMPEVNLEPVPPLPHWTR